MGRPTIGVLLGLGAGLLWGTVFVAPQLLPSFGPVEVALGRYFLYGVFSVGLLAASGLRRSSGEGVMAVAKKAWSLALAFAFSGNVGMYLLLVVGIRLAGAPLATTLIGTVPVTVAVAGNLLERPPGYKPGRGGARRAGRRGQVARAAVRPRDRRAVDVLRVANARFLRTNPSVSGLAWAPGCSSCRNPTATGSSSATSGTARTTSAKVATSTIVARLAWFLAVSAFLGVVVSWGGTLLRNGASARLPTSLAGQLVVSEILAGLFYVFVANGRLPSVLELAGILAVVSGVAIGIRRAGAPSPGAGTVTCAQRSLWNPIAKFGEQLFHVFG
jgi:drug/metabolite transporter (DMT)-like permease